MPKYFDFEVSLLGVEPRMWRRFLLKDTATFEDLHRAIQDAGGWEDYHLYEFRDSKGKKTIARAPYEDSFDEEHAPAVGKVRLTSHFTRKGAKCLYVYDFGDDWHHVVELKQVAEMAERFTRRLVDGARALPPEDCGGEWGYARCLAALGLVDAGDFDTGDLEETREWLGDWNPEEFDLAAVRKRFDRLVRRSLKGEGG
jgi:hypothetical protein